MTQPDSRTMSTMAQYARHRASLWRLMETVVGPITDELLARATDGKLAREVESAAHFAGETNPFDDVVPSRRDVFEHRRRVDEEIERDTLRSELEAVHDPSIAEFFSGAARACDDEADAWDSDDGDAAKAARLAQFTSLREELERLTDWCVALHRRAESVPGRMLAGLVAAHLALESGVNVPEELRDDD